MISYGKNIEYSTVHAMGLELANHLISLGLHDSPLGPVEFIAL